MSLISFTHIQWEHRLFHRGLAKTGSSLVTFRTEVGIICCHINMGTSFITSKYFFFKRHLSSGRCRYCFLETRPISHIHYIRYIRWKRTLWSRKVSFLTTLLFSHILLCGKDFRPTLLYSPQSSRNENLRTRIWDRQSGVLLVMKEKFKWKNLQPASGGNGGNS